MFSHVGMLTLKSDATDEHRRAIIAGLGGLVGTIDGLVRVRAGYDLGLTEGNASVLFVLEFDDQPSWAAYRTHQAHVAVIKERIAPVLEVKSFVQVAAIDVVAEAV